MKCLLDLDGVLVDFMKGAHEFYGLPYSYDCYPYEYATWDCMPPKDVTSMSPREFWDGLTAEFWASLEWMPDGKDILALIERYLPQSDICILTTPTLNHSSIAGKICWIEKEMPNYSRRFLVGPAKEFCASNHRVLIDDADHNIESFREAGGLTITVPRKWNSMCYENTLPFIKNRLFALLENFPDE